MLTYRQARDVYLERGSTPRTAAELWGECHPRISEELALTPIHETATGINTGWPLWIWLKLAIWVVFGAATVVARRASDKAVWLLFLLPVLGAVSAWLALYQVGGAAQP